MIGEHEIDEMLSEKAATEEMLRAAVADRRSGSDRRHKKRPWGSGVERRFNQSEQHN